MEHINAAIERVVHAAQPVATVDPLPLDEVAAEDRPLVQNVIYALLACRHPERLCTTWAVSCTATHYVVTAALPEGDFDISLLDLELVQSLSPLRITTLGVSCSNARCKVFVHVANGKQRLSLTNGDLIITQKRRRMFL